VRPTGQNLGLWKERSTVKVLDIRGTGNSSTWRHVQGPVGMNRCSCAPFECLTSKEMATLAENEPQLQRPSCLNLAGLAFWSVEC
jgi:hypothetical protein